MFNVSKDISRKMQALDLVIDASLAAVIMLAITLVLAGTLFPEMVSRFLANLVL